MSKTDKTRPYHLKVEEYRVLRPRLVDENGYDYRTYEWWRGEFRCGCKMCDYDAYQTPRRKKERAAGKKECREWEE